LAINKAYLNKNTNSNAIPTLKKSPNHNWFGLIK
jgi:hypothetical protein